MYEIHITVEPDPDTPTEDFREFFVDSSWRFSCFDEDEVDGIAGKWFLTTHAGTYPEAEEKLKDQLGTFKRTTFKVLRSKIEHIVYDTKRGDHPL